MVIQVELEEINTIPKGYDSSLYESKGFYPITLVQDFLYEDHCKIQRTL